MLVVRACANICSSRNVANAVGYIASAIIQPSARQFLNVEYHCTSDAWAGGWGEGERGEINIINACSLQEHLGKAQQELPPMQPARQYQMSKGKFKEKASSSELQSFECNLMRLECFEKKRWGAGGGAS